MSTNQTIENLKESHLVGIKGFFTTAGVKDTLTSTVNLFSMFIALLATATCIVAEVSLYATIKEIKDVLLSFLPSILGFTIAGFTLLVGFLQTDLLESITEKTKDSRYSLYQRLVSKFALNVFLQSISLIVAYLFHFVMFYESHVKYSLVQSAENSVNAIGVFVIAYCFTLSVSVVCQVIINIFNFSQVHHFIIVKGKLDKQNGGKKEG